MRHDVLAVEYTCRSKNEGTRADARDPARARRSFRDPADVLFFEVAGFRAQAACNDERVNRVRKIMSRHGIAKRHAPAGQQMIAASRRHNRHFVVIVVGEDFKRPGYVENLYWRRATDNDVSHGSIVKGSSLWSVIRVQSSMSEFAGSTSWRPCCGRHTVVPVSALTGGSMSTIASFQQATGPLSEVKVPDTQLTRE